MPITLEDIQTLVITGTVANYSALPAANTVSGQYYWVLAEQGTWWLPGSLGGTYYNKGIYRSNGTIWEFQATPANGTQGQVDAGINNDTFVTPLTLKNSTQWATKQDTLVSGINIKTLYGASLLGSGDLILGAITGATSFNGLVITANTGVITTGTWNGSIISPTYGGTGINNGANTLTLSGVTSITGGGTIALAGSTLTVPATGTATLGSPGASGRVFVGTSATTGAGSVSLLYSSNSLQNTVSTNGLIDIRVTNSNAGAGAQAAFVASNGTSLLAINTLGTGYTTAGLLVANETTFQSTTTVGTLFSNSGASSFYKWAIGGTATANEKMRLTSTGLGINTLADPNSTLEVAGSLSLSYVAKTASYTLTASDHTVDCTVNSFNLTLPTAAGCTGRIYNLKNSGTGVITILTTSGQTVDGQISGYWTLVRSGDINPNMQVQSNGANWIIL